MSKTLIRKERYTMKRKIAALMAVILAAGTVQAVPFTAFAEVNSAAAQTASASSEKKDTASEEEQMKNALALVKSRITIPEEYSSFSYSTNQSDGMRSYSFTWTEPTGSRSYYAAVTGDIITSYRSPTENSWKSGISDHNPSYFTNKALSWVYKVNPSMKGFLTKSSISLSVNDDSVYVNFGRSFGGLKVKGGNWADVTLNKYTGEVTGYNGVWWQNAEFVSAAGALSQEDIKKIYCDEVTIKPYYRIYTDETTGKKKTNIVYEPMNSYTYDALTGKHSAMDDDYLKFMDTDLYDNGMALDGAGDIIEETVEEDCAEGSPATGVSFTEEELAAAADLSTMLTSDQFKALAVKDKYMGITEKYLVKNFNIEKNDNAECGFAITCNMIINNKTDSRTVVITADAKSGKIMSFYTYSDESKAEINVKKATTLANAALKYYYGDIADEYKADTGNSAPVQSSGSYKETSRTMRYNRYVNNIQVSGNYINITVNSAGKVTSVSAYHDKDVDFGDGLIINKETALTLLCEQQDMELYYDGFLDLESKPHTYLHYAMPSWKINGVNGKLCDYNGKAVSKAAKTPDTCPYKDIAKSPYKSEITALYEHNVRIYEGSEFKPTEKMTFTEFTRLLDTVTGYGYEPVPLEEVIEDIPDDGSSAVSKTAASEYFTRMTLAKEFVRAAQAERFAGYTSIYKSPFTDVSSKDENLGYAALAYAMGAVKAGKDGKFYPNAYVTREYAYHCAYNYLKAMSDNG